MSGVHLLSLRFCWIFATKCPHIFGSALFEFFLLAFFLFGLIIYFYTDLWTQKWCLFVWWFSLLSRKCDLLMLTTIKPIHNLHIRKIYRGFWVVRYDAHVYALFHFIFNSYFSLFLFCALRNGRAEMFIFNRFKFETNEIRKKKLKYNNTIHIKMMMINIIMIIMIVKNVVIIWWLFVRPKTSTTLKDQPIKREKKTLRFFFGHIFEFCLHWSSTHFVNKTSSKPNL